MDQLFAPYTTHLPLHTLPISTQNRIFVLLDFSNPIGCSTALTFEIGCQNQGSVRVRVIQTDMAATRDTTQKPGGSVEAAVMGGSGGAGFLNTGAFGTRAGSELL